MGDSGLSDAQRGFFFFFFFSKGVSDDRKVKNNISRKY